MEGNMSERWLILKYIPVTLFSLRMTHATNKGGKTLLVPTPYAFKMTLLDACFRVFEKDNADSMARTVFDIVKKCAIRFSPPSNCIVQNTFIKILDENRDLPGLFKPSIAYREFCFFNGCKTDDNKLNVAMNITDIPEEVVSLLIRLGFHVNCIGKRGSFWQYVEHIIHNGPLSKDYTFPYEDTQRVSDKLSWTQYLDDFGASLCSDKNGFDRVSTYGEGDVRLGKHRVLVKTLIPYRFKRSSRHFTQYEKTQYE